MSTINNKRFLLTGFPVSPGFASGTATVYDFNVERKLRLPNREIVRSEIGIELGRLDLALDKATLDLADQDRDSKEFGGVEQGTLLPHTVLWQEKLLRWSSNTWDVN